MASGHSSLSQILSRPETMFIVTVSGETCHVQASEVRVCRLIMMVMSAPPIGARWSG